MTKRLIVGGCVAALYVGAAAFLHSVRPFGDRPLYDGIAPPVAYNFVSPPPDLKGQNVRPTAGKGTIDIVDGKSASNTVSTADGQAVAVFPEGTFNARRGEKAIKVSIAPLAPPEPLDLAGGLQITGNAYRVSASYARSEAPASVKKAITVVMRYPVRATVLVRRTGSSWTSLKTQISQASLQLFGEAKALGTFAAAGKPERRRPWIPYVAAFLGVVAGVVGYLQGRQSARKRKRRRAR